MHLDDPADASFCAFCGLRWSDVAGGVDWVHLEVTRGNGSGGLDWLDVDFCSQAHAAAWLGRPLPPVQSAPLLPRTARHRLADVGLIGFFGGIAALACVGVYAIGDWLGVYG